MKQQKFTTDELINDAIDKALPYKPQQHRAELFPFLKFCVEHKVKNVLEIGSYDGGLTHIFSELFESVVAIDLKHRATYEKSNIKRITMDTQVNPITNKEFINEVETNGGFDLIFIDGLHTHQGVSNDYNLFFSFRNKKGIIAIHDIKDSEGHAEHNCFVSKLWNTLEYGFFNCNLTSFISSENTWLADINPKYKDRMGEFGGIGVIY